MQEHARGAYTVQRSSIGLSRYSGLTTFGDPISKLGLPHISRTIMALFARAREDPARCSSDLLKSSSNQTSPIVTFQQSAKICYLFFLSSHMASRKGGSEGAMKPQHTLVLDLLTEQCALCEVTSCWSLRTCQENTRCSKGRHCQKVEDPDGGSSAAASRRASGVKPKADTQVVDIEIRISDRPSLFAAPVPQP